MSEQPKTDGRHRRGERSRQAILDAACDMVADGVLAPTAQEIAERAGVGIRTLFRQFEGMDDLYAAIEETKGPNNRARFTQLDRHGSFEDRLLHAVEQRAIAYDELQNTLLFGQTQRWRSEVLRKSYVRSNHRLRKDLEDWLPELLKLPEQSREAVDAVTSFEMWYRLREHQNMSTKAATALVHALLSSLVVGLG